MANKTKRPADVAAPDRGKDTNHSEYNTHRPKTQRRKWTSREVQALIQMHNDRCPGKEIAKALHRSQESIEKKIRALRQENCSKLVRIRSFGGRPAEWTDREDRILLQMIAKGCRYKAVAEVLHRSTASVEGRIYRLLKQNPTALLDMAGASPPEEEEDEPAEPAGPESPPILCGECARMTDAAFDPLCGIRGICEADGCRVHRCDFCRIPAAAKHRGVHVVLNPKTKAVIQ